MENRERGFLGRICWSAWKRSPKRERNCLVARGFPAVCTGPQKLPGQKQYHWMIFPGLRVKPPSKSKYLQEDKLNTTHPVLRMNVLVSALKTTEQRVSFAHQEVNLFGFRLKLSPTHTGNVPWSSWQTPRFPLRTHRLTSFGHPDAHPFLAGPLRLRASHSSASGHSDSLQVNPGALRFKWP